VFTLFAHTTERPLTPACLACLSRDTRVKPAKFTAAKRDPREKSGFHALAEIPTPTASSLGQISNTTLALAKEEEKEKETNFVAEGPNYPISRIPSPAHAIRR